MEPCAAISRRKSVGERNTKSEDENIARRGG
jgi:hypothetical protein